jgi:hypothetical protein
MNTRLSVVIFTFIIFATILTSCKTNTRPFAGEYTYQSDGSIKIGLLVTDVDIPLTDKMGQMQIMKGEGKGKVVIIRTGITGDIKRLSGEISGNEITIDEYTYEKKIELDTIINGKAKIKYSSKGRLRDNTIVFDDNYSGFFTEAETGAVGTIRGNNTITVAKLND